MANIAGPRTRTYTGGIQVRSGTAAAYNKKKAAGIVVDSADGYKLKYNQNGSIVTLTTASGAPVAPTALTTNGAIAPNTAANYIITKAGVLADTLAAPTVTTSDGLEIKITSGTANAHTITATGLLQTGSASVNVATFNANAGASLTLMAYQGLWFVRAANGISFS
jgi:hypothetical protein